jgi:tubulin polyglutamylase TTLL6/13
MRMKKIFPDDYNFFPKTWILPSEMTDFKNQFSTQNGGTGLKTKKGGHKIFIVKPVHLCQGRGIFLVRKFEDVELKHGD